MSTGIIVRERDHLRALVLEAIEAAFLTLLRHILSQYRMHASGASASFMGKVAGGSEEIRVNRFHHWYCRTARWRKTVEQRIPWVLDGIELGPSLLELGPGPGLTTDFLRSQVQRLTAIEIDPALAEPLRLRLRGTNVEVVTGDATALPFSDKLFSSGVSFTMLHHVPSRDLQDRVLREMWRVLKPGGTFAGADSRQSYRMRLIHLGDTLVPIDPDTFGRRLEVAGFDVLVIEKNEQAFRFQARRPSAAIPNRNEN